MFAAIRTWEEYLRCYHMNHGPDLFIEHTAALYRPFFLYSARDRPWQEAASAALAKTLRSHESQVELWYPVSKRPYECVVAYSSFLPILFYYLHKIEEWGYVFQQCKVCGKDFLARSRHYEICGDACRKVQAVEAKRQFDERAKDDRLEQLHESAYYYWYNRLRKLKRKNAAPEKVAAVEVAFKAFREEAKAKKTAVRRNEVSLSDYGIWLLKEQDTVDALMED